MKNKSKTNDGEGGGRREDEINPQEIHGMIQKLGLQNFQNSSPSTSYNNNNKTAGGTWKGKPSHHGTYGHQQQQQQIPFIPHQTGVQSRNYLLVKPDQKLMMLEFPSDPMVFDPVPIDQLAKFRTKAAQILESEIELYQSKKKGARKSSSGFMKTVASSGVTADRVAALTIIIQDSPVHSLSTLDALIGMVRKKAKRESMMAIDSLKELFLNDLLPDLRKMRTFSHHPFTELDALSSGNKDMVDKRLLLWFFEDQLKVKYSEFIYLIDQLGRENIPTVKTKCLDTIFQLLSNKPEQEQALLGMLVNKIGDPDYRTAAKTSHLLTKLVEIHSNMKTVVVGEVERLLYRQNISAKAQYYAMCFLNQIVLSHEEDNLAAKLIQIYFAFFKAYIMKGELESKVLGAVLTGVNRAYPYSKRLVDDGKINEQLSAIYRMLHIVNFNISIQAMMLLCQVMDSRKAVSDRFYTALYKKLSDPALKKASRQGMFLNVLYKAIKRDVSLKRVKAFIKRLLQVCSYMQPPFICGALFLVSEVFKTRIDLLKNAEVIDDSDEEHFVDFDVDDVTGETVQTKTSTDPKRKLQSDYNPHNRNPMYSGSENTEMWELIKLSHHYHPSVSLFAGQILKSELVTYPGNPLTDFTLIRFLDRFVFRNPKKTHERISVMQPMNKTQPRIRQVAVNTKEFLNADETNIPVDDRYLHRYFKRKSQTYVERPRATKEEDFDSDVESIDDETFDRVLDHYEKTNAGAVDMDFATDFISKQSTKTKSTKKQQKDNDDDDDDDDNDDDDELGSDLDEEEFDLGDLSGMSEEDDEDGGGQFLDIDEEGGKKRKNLDDLSASSSKRNKKSEQSLFAAADEFSHLIEEASEGQLDFTGSNAIVNKDKSHVKQLKWEMERDRVFQGKDWKSRKRGTNIKKKKFQAGKKTIKKKIQR